MFEEKQLLGITLSLFVLGLCLILAKGDDGAIIYFSAGFFYTLTLWGALEEKLSLVRLLIGGVILSVSSFFSVLASAPVNLLPRNWLKETPYVSEYILYLLPSLAGAWITLLVLKFIWKLNIKKKHWVVISVCMLIVPLITSIVLNNLGNKNHIQDDFRVSLNSLIWWLGFSISLVIVQRLNNKSS